MNPAATQASDTTARIARFVAGAVERGLPAPVAASAARAFANWTGCALGACADPAVLAVARMARGVGGSGDSSLVGRGGALDCVNAALVNGTAANALDYDDMHVPTLIHPTGPVVAAALAVAEQRRASGATLLAAAVAGMEVECRLGLALFPAHYDAGWHITATTGTLGAAAAACAVMGAGEETVRHALGIAATTAGGLRSMLSNSCKSLNIGKAAAAGVSAALLAQAGLDSDASVLDSRFGFLDVFGRGGVDAHALTDGLGERYLVPEISLKPYPCGVVIHPVIDACLALARPGELLPGQVREVRLSVSARAAELADRPRPDSALAGRYSLQHAAALALARGRAGLAEFAIDVGDPLVGAWRSRMVLEVDAALGASEARAALVLAEGGRREQAVDRPSGSPGRPLTDAQLEAKFLELCARAIAPAAGQRLYADCLALDRLRDVNALRAHWSAAPAHSPLEKGEQR